MQKLWANTLESLVPNGYRELNLSSKGKTPRLWLELAPAPDTHTHTNREKKTQKSKTRFTNFIINFDRNQITKYLKSQQSTHSHTHTHIRIWIRTHALCQRQLYLRCSSFHSMTFWWSLFKQLQTNRAATRWHSKRQLERIFSTLISSLDNELQLSQANQLSQAQGRTVGQWGTVGHGRWPQQPP